VSVYTHRQIIVSIPQEHLHGYLEKSLPSVPYKKSKVVSAIKSSFSKMSKKILKEDCIKRERSGSTAVVSLFIGDSLYVANVGDARAVLARYYYQQAVDSFVLSGLFTEMEKDNAYQWTTRQRLPKSNSESVTLVALSHLMVEVMATYIPVVAETIGLLTLFSVNGRLAVSRAFGDSGFVPFVSAEPHIYTQTIGPQVLPLIINASF